MGFIIKVEIKCDHDFLTFYIIHTCLAFALNNHVPDHFCVTVNVIKCLSHSWSHYTRWANESVTVG